MFAVQKAPLPQGLSHQYRYSGHDPAVWRGAAGRGRGDAVQEQPPVRCMRAGVRPRKTMRGALHSGQKRQCRSHQQHRKFHLLPLSVALHAAGHQKERKNDRHHRLGAGGHNHCGSPGPAGLCGHSVRGPGQDRRSIALRHSGCRAPCWKVTTACWGFSG